MAYVETLTAEAAFQRYEDLRERFPVASFPEKSTDCAGLVEIADQVDAFVLDSFGVLNVGDRAIPGARDCIEKLRAMGKQLIVLTNAASYPLSVALDKYHRLGFDFTAEEVVSSRDVAAAHLGALVPTGRWGAVAAADDRFEDLPADVRHWDGDHVDGFLLLSSAEITPGLIERLKAALRDRVTPIAVANPDLVAPRESGLSKEPGYFAHLLADELGVLPTFFGKPFGNAFEEAFLRLGGPRPERIAMVGDTLHTDILGGRSVGAKTVLVRNYGLFAGADVDGYITRSGIVPDFQCGGI
ncbi:MAG: HAD family hydrolase [Pseudomonadota bacterium]